jgi:hypothetical protein
MSRPQRSAGPAGDAAIGGTSTRARLDGRASGADPVGEHTEPGGGSGALIRGIAPHVDTAEKKATVLQPVLIRLEDDSLVDELCQHFRRSGFAAERLRGCMIDVRLPDAPDTDQQRREVEAHLLIWHVMNPDAAADLLGLINPVGDL